MNGHQFNICGATLMALPCGALWWPEHRILTLSDLHLGKAERAARRSGALLPPYEIHDTLLRLDQAIADADPAVVICLGDSFDDDLASDSLDRDQIEWLTRLQAGREWVWIAGNHDPAPFRFGGSHRQEYHAARLVFRHIALPGALGEVSGHYHPKARIGLRTSSVTRPCFLYDDARVILPAFGTYTGGLHAHHDALCGLMGDGARAVLTGKSARVFPMPR